MTWQEHTVKCTVQISTQNTAQSFGQFGQMVWVFVYELSGSEFESSCSHYNYHFANHLFVIIIIINYHQYYLLVTLFLFTSCFTIFKAFTNSFFAFLIIQFFLGTKMKIRHSLVLCYPSHLAFAFYYQWFKSLSALTIIVN